VVKQIVASGFELAAHNYAQDQVLPGLTEAEERAVIRRSIGILEDGFGGRPLISAVLDQMLRYITGHPGVWFARHDELARWINDRKIDEIAYAERFAL